MDERFLDGSVAMLMSSRRDVPLLRTIDDFEWDVAPFPKDAEPASVLHSDGFCIAKGGNADAAWTWIEFALGPKGQEVLARSGRSVPSLRAVAESPVFLESPDPPASSQVFLDALEHMRRCRRPRTGRAWSSRPTTCSWSSSTAGWSSTRRWSASARETDGQF